MPKIRTVTLLACAAILFDSGLAFADKVCARVKRGRLSKREVTTGNCPRGFLMLVDTATLQGPAGAAGATGAAGVDGAIRVYGDGSDGAVTFSANATFPPNRQYTNIVVNAGVIMTVQLGTVIRCTGTITINGRLVASGAAGVIGNLGNWPSSTVYSAANVTFPDANIAASRAGSGAVTGTSDLALGGSGGGRVVNDERRAAALLAKPLLGGGNGAGSVGDFGGSGGGPIVILCREGISIPAGGQIESSGFDGGAGGGGGAGGTILLASSGEISGAGALKAVGGDGGGWFSSSAAGGGGGGGIIQMFAPLVSFTGTTDLVGGVGGPSGGPVNALLRSGGGGGGGAGGDGGAGGQTNPDDASTGGGTGSIGYFYSANLDPTALLLMQ